MRTNRRMLRLILLAGVLLLVSGTPLTAQVHRSPMAEKWYPAGKAELARSLEKAFEAAESRAGGVPPRKKLHALVAPHAGIQYSGVVAASAYRLLDNPKNVILLGFSHQKPLRGIVVPRLEAYVTPLGSIRVNREALAELGFPSAGEDELCDHSLENQLPFVQHAAPGAAVVPLYAGELSRKELVAAAAKLAARIRKGDVVIASSDFTHYGKAYGYLPYPNDEKIRTRLFNQAMHAFEEIGSIQVGEFDSYLSATGDTICGQQPIRLLMATLAQLEKDEEIYLQPADYMTSGDLTGDYSMSVGYGALAFYPASAFQVGPDDQGRLLASARQTLNRYLTEKAKAEVPVPTAERSPDLMQRNGVFVTIKKNGELRGCVGTFAGNRSLWDIVPDRTLAATSADPRFPALTREEGPVSLEISLLTPVKKIAGWKAFQTGKGAILLLEDKAGTLLPQIAGEMGWNREEFLENLARKAGLDPSAYRHPRARLYVFEAQVFAERSGETADGNSHSSQQ
jgi:AmmeMemoRadiSam system protein B/AmmeMemoRadiSam system protein A